MRGPAPQQPVPRKSICRSSGKWSAEVSCPGCVAAWQAISGRASIESARGNGCEFSYHLTFVAVQRVHQVEGRSSCAAEAHATNHERVAIESAINAAAIDAYSQNYLQLSIVLYEREGVKDLVSEHMLSVPRLPVYIAKGTAGFKQHNTY